MFTQSALIALATVLVLALVGSYVVGAQVGRRRVRLLTRIVVEALRPIGEQGSVRLLGTTGCDIRLAKVRSPFVNVRVVVWLQPREFFPIWAINHLRGRHDLIGIAADLSTPPIVSFELGDPTTPAGKRALAKARDRGWTEASWTFAGRPMRLAAADSSSTRRFLSRLSGPSALEAVVVSRLGLSADSPHLSITIREPAALGEYGPGFVSWLTRLASAVGEPGGATESTSEPTRAQRIQRGRRPRR